MQHDYEEQIVQLLQTHLQIKFTLYQFSQLANRELLDLVNLVIHSVNPEQPEKIGTETIEETVDRMSEFLRIMKYDFPCEPQEWDRRMAAADPTILHPAILFLLRDFEGMKKRAYIAKYNEEVHVPEEIAVEPTVSELMKQDRELREQFEKLHQEFVELEDVSIEKLREMVKDLQSDKARLATKIGTFKRKMDSVKNLGDLLKLTGRLRTESERELKISEQNKRLSEDKRLILHRQQVASDRIKNMKAHYEDKLNAARSELATLKNAASEKPSDDKGLILFQQQVMQVRKLIEQKKVQLQDIKNKYIEAEKMYQEKKSLGIIELPPPAQFSKFVGELKSKNENYKQKMAQINAQNKELAVMMRTKAIATEQYEKVREEIEKAEKARGIFGFREARQQLEEVSAKKADLDDTKGKTLEEMSEIVQEIQRAIQARQNELRPYVSQLQEKRKQKSEIADKYLAAKQKYINAVSEYETKCKDLDNECEKLRGEIARYQSKFYQAQSYNSAVMRNQKRASEEAKSIESGNPVNKTIKSYSDSFQKESNNLKKSTAALKEKKKTTGSQTVENQKQLENFTNLRRLLQIKLECQKAAAEKKKQIKKQEEIERQNPEQIVVLN